MSSDLHARIAELATFNDETVGSGITREIYSPTYEASLAVVRGWMEEAGLATRVDAAGNLWGSWEGSDPSLKRIVTGSHFDTTLNAGAYDGVLGVLGAIEAVRQLRAAGVAPRRTLEVIGFAGEEPRFGAGCIGSRMLMGALSRAELDAWVDRDGVSIAAAMQSVGLDPDAVGAARLDDENVEAFVELHIEQGGLLEARGLPIGLVEGIAAPHDLRVTLTGWATHSGATPMGLRRDALAGAAEAVLAVERLALESASDRTVGTVGVLGVSPGAVNIVPGAVTMDVDIRDIDLAVREQVIADLKEELARIGEARNLEVEISLLTKDTPADCAPVVVEAVRGACDEAGLEYLPMISGAYHDAMVLGATIPMGMIFVPSRDGLSHHPDEYTAPEELDRGVTVLAGALKRLCA